MFEELSPGAVLTANELRTAFKRNTGMSWDAAAKLVVQSSGASLPVQNLPRFVQRFPETFRVEVDQDGATVISMVADLEKGRIDRAYANETEMIDCVIKAMSSVDGDPTVPRDHWELERVFEHTHGEAFYQRAMRLDKANPSGVPRNMSLVAFAQSLPEFFVVEVTPLSTTVALNPLAQTRFKNRRTGEVKGWDPQVVSRKEENANKLVEAITALYRDLPPEIVEAPEIADEPTNAPVVSGRAVPILPRVHRGSIAAAAAAAAAASPVSVAITSPSGEPLPPYLMGKQLSPSLNLFELESAFRARYGESFRCYSERLERQNRSDGIAYANLQHFMKKRSAAFLEERKEDQPTRYRAVLW